MGNEHGPAELLKGIEHLWGTIFTNIGLMGRSISMSDDHSAASSSSKF